MAKIAELRVLDPIELSATGSWLRPDARYGAVLRCGHALVPLLV